MYETEIERLILLILIPKMPAYTRITCLANRDVNLTFRADIKLAEEAGGLSLTGSSKLSSLSYVRNKTQITELEG